MSLPSGGRISSAATLSLASVAAMAWGADAVHENASVPALEEFMRHLQAGLDEAMEIDDEIERNDRILQLEIAIQEAIIFKNRYQELVSHGIDPLVLVKQKDGEEMPPPVTKSQALTLGVSTCTKCGATLDAELDFCPTCGEIQK